MRPGTIGTSAAATARRAASLLPSSSWVAGDGPIHVSPASSTARAKAALSERKPYPGWTACAPVRLAAAISAETLRYEADAAAGPMGAARSAACACTALLSASEKTATLSMSISRRVRAMRTAISPRFAIRTRLKGRRGLSLRTDSQRYSGMLPCFFAGKA